LTSPGRQRLCINPSQRHSAWLSIIRTTALPPLDGGSESDQQTGFFDIYHFVSNSSGHVPTTVNIGFRRATSVPAQDDRRTLHPDVSLDAPTSSRQPSDIT
jgi:hypothetical protein